MKLTRKKRLSYTSCAEAIVNKMTLEEKVGLMSGDTSLQKITCEKQMGVHWNQYPYGAGGNQRFGVPKILFCDGGRGVVCGVRRATCFPVPIMRGATFDVKLEKQIGHAIGREVRAFGGNFFGGICVNLPYHPGWGRCQEVYGEDSCLLGAMGSALIQGVQDEYVIACVKHYAFNSMENSRFKVSIDCGVRTEREVFLRHFKECIDSGAAAVMSAYNKYRGILCGHSEYLLRRVLKGEWQFDGFVISDFFWGISDTERAVTGGCDVEMCHTSVYGKQLLDAVRSGRVDESLIDEAAMRIVRTMVAFDREFSCSGQKAGEEVIGCRQHAKLALRAAQEGITLIKNENHVLPLSRNMKRIAVIGKLAAEENTGDRGSSRVYPEHVITPLEGIVKKVPGSEVVYYDGDDPEHMKRLAAGADAVIFIVGLNHRDEGEYKQPDPDGTRGGDRESLRLHRSEVEMLEKVGDINPVSAVVVMGGGTVLISEWEQKISAILFTYYPGQEGGTALAQILFGEVNPSGKLPFTLPAEEFDLPCVDWDAAEQHYGYYCGYRRLDKLGIEPFRPFGYGLSYTEFTLSEPEAIWDKGRLSSFVTVKNTGTAAGTEVVQMYAGFSRSALDRPVKILCGFQRVRLKPDEEKRVRISCPGDRLKYYDVHSQKFVLERMETDVYIGTSASEKDLLKKTVYVDG